MEVCAHFSSTYTKIRVPERRLAWPLYKDDSQIRLTRSPPGRYGIPLYP